MVGALTVARALIPGVAWVEVLEVDQWRIPNSLFGPTPERGSEYLFRGTALESYPLSMSLLRRPAGRA